MHGIAKYKQNTLKVKAIGNTHHGFIDIKIL